MTATRDPGYFTTDGGTISDFNAIDSYTTNAYRFGVDFRVLPRTTLSFDEFLSYYRQDNVVTDNPAVNPGNFGFIIANPSAVGTPERHTGGPGKRLEYANTGRGASLRDSDRGQYNQYGHAHVQRIFVV